MSTSDLFTRDESGSGPALGRYQIVETVAIHDQSTVFKAFDPDLQRHVSLKLYHAHASTGVESVQQVIAEARALVRIDSPFVAKCHNVETIQNTPILVNEWIEGQSLDKYLVDHALSFGEVKALFVSIATGVQAIHDQGLLHRDIKPSNIIIGTDGRPRIIDLGLVHDDEDAPEYFAGTPSYVSPEVAAHEPGTAGRATDIFGLGAVLYFLLTGRPPFEGATKSDVLRNARDGAIVPSHEVAETSPNKLDRICAKCLQRDPSARFQSANEVLSGLRGSRVPAIVGVVLVTAAVGWGVLVLTSKTEARAAGRGGPDDASLAPATSRGEAKSRPTLSDDPAVQAALAGDFEEAVRRARGTMTGDDGEPRSPREVRRALSFIADCAMQDGDLALLADVCQERVDFDTAREPASLWSHNARVEQQQALLLKQLSPGQLAEFSAAKKLVFEALLMLGQRQGYEVARKKCAAAWPNLQRVLGPQHLETVRCQSAHALSLLGVDARSQALALYEEIDKGLRGVFGAESLDQLELWKLRFEVLLKVAGRPDLALLDCERALPVALRVHPANSMVVMQLRAKACECLIVDRQFVEAKKRLNGLLVELVRRGASGSVGELWIRMLRARMGIGAGEIEAAKADMNRIEALALQLENKGALPSRIRSDVALLRSQWFELHGDSQRAADQIRVRIELRQSEPGEAEGLILATSLEAVYLARCQKHREALALAMEAQTRSNDLISVQDAEVHCNLAEVHYRAKRPERAREHLERVVSKLRCDNLVQCWAVRKRLDELASVDEAAAKLANDALQQIHQRVLAAGDDIPLSIRERVRECFP